MVNETTIDWSTWSTNPTQPPIQAAQYEASRTHRLNERHWAIGEQLADPTPEQRATLRNRTRYEVANNSLLEGMIETYARDLVGSGPHPTFQEFGRERARVLQEAWKDWSDSVQLAPLCKTIARAYLTDGEVFLLGIDEPPYLRLIEPERITAHFSTGPLSLQKMPTPDNGAILEGIRYNNGQPVEYFVDDRPYPAQVVNHLYRQQFPNQRRGVPRPAPSLDMFAFIRRTNIACVTSYEAVAKIALVLQAKMLQPNQVGRPFETFDLVNGSVMTLPEGYELGQVAAEHPSASHREVISMFIGEAARSFPMPLNKALGTSQDSNFASGSLDNIDYERAIQNDQFLLNVGPVARIVALFLMLQGETPRRCFVGWDAIPHLNPEKQYAAIKTKLELRLTSRTREAAKLGADWQDIERELKAEEELIGANQPNEPGGNLGDTPNDFEPSDGQA